MNTKGFYGLYNNEMAQSGNTLAMMGGNRTTIKNEKPEEDPPKTLGGALMAGLGGAGSGALMGSAIPGMGTGAGAAGGFALGFAAYYMS